MIYLFDDMENISADVISETFALMPHERRQRSLRYKREIDRYCCVLAYWLLLNGLKNEYGITDPPVFTYGENGKPYLDGHPDIFFNLSHCREGVVCVISNAEIGVDIQDVRPLNIDVAKRVCTISELDRISWSREPERLFCEIWTIKESFIKQQGGSITQPLKMLDAHTLFEQVNSKKICHWGNRYHLCCIGEEMINED